MCSHHRVVSFSKDIFDALHNLFILCYDSDMFSCPAGLGPSSHKQSEERPRLSEERYEGEPNTRGMAQIPLRISVRKLSFHFRPQQTKETARSQDPPYKGIPRVWDVSCFAIQFSPSFYQPQDFLVSSSTETRLLLLGLAWMHPFQEHWQNYILMLE